jgi:hypothetical protein
MFQYTIRVFSLLVCIYFAPPTSICVDLGGPLISRVECRRRIAARKNETIPTIAPYQSMPLSNNQNRSISVTIVIVREIAARKVRHTNGDTTQE